jgi:hypothetical protein
MSRGYIGILGVTSCNSEIGIDVSEEPDVAAFWIEGGESKDRDNTRRSLVASVYLLLHFGSKMPVLSTLLSSTGSW